MILDGPPGRPAREDSSAPGSGEPFGDRLARAVDEKGSCLVVGLDPVLERLPPEVLGMAGLGSAASEGRTARAAAALGFFLARVIEAVAETAVAVKPNTAFFERFGAAGWDCLREVCHLAKKAGLLVIADAKRGDVGHTAEAYADSVLGDLADTVGPEVDAVTVHPYLGTDSLLPFVRRAREARKGLFVLVRTSNPSAGDLQDLHAGDRPVYLHVAEMVRRLGEGLEGRSGFGPVGAVVGGTAPVEAARMRGLLSSSFFLVPGYGAQGAGARQLAACFLAGGRGAVVNSSRRILFAYQERGGSWVEAIRAAASEAREELEGARCQAR